MKPILILIAAIVLGLSNDAFARIGQTEEQVGALFGKTDRRGQAGQSRRDDTHIQEPKR